MKTRIECTHEQRGDWILAPVADIKTPKPCRICWGPRWWAVTADDKVLFYRSYNSPQCHPNKAMVGGLSQLLDAPATTPQWIETAFLPHQCE